MRFLNLNSRASRFNIGLTAFLALLLVGCGGGGGGGSSASTPAATAAALSISPATQNFGSVAIGSTSTPVTFTVTNTGGTASGTITTSFAGTDANQFVMGTNTCTGTLAPSATCTIVVTFFPSIAGAKTASLNVSATPGGSVSTSLSGATSATLTITPTPQSFGPVAGGSTSTPVTFTVTNTGGTASGNITTVLSGTDAIQFQKSSDTCVGTVLAAGTSCTIAVSFAPTAGSINTKTASLDVSANPGGTVSASLSGVTPAVLSISSTSNPYGSVAVGSASPSVIFTVTNIGGAASGAVTASLGGAAPLQFQISSNACTSSLAPGATCNVTVSFQPISAVAATATLDVSATPGGIVSASLSGTGTTPTLTITPLTQAFGAVAVVAGTPTSFTFTITNTGAIASARLTTSLGGVDAGQFSLPTGSNTCTGALVPAGQSCTIMVTFSPTITGLKAATLNVSAPGSGAVSANLNGSGL